MNTYRFNVYFLPNGHGCVFRCLHLSADSEWGLARKLVEDDAPDGPIQGGREGKHDWSFHSLHRFAVGAVRAKEADHAPERLHPTLKAAVVATRAARARKVAA